MSLIACLSLAGLLGMSVFGRIPDITRTPLGRCAQHQFNIASL